MDERYEPCLDTDEASGWTAKEFASFVKAHTWQYARTMPRNPHEYTLRRNTEDATFDAAVRYIREHRVIERYEGVRYKTLYCGDHKFWTMGAQVSETTLINRKPKDADDQGRLLIRREANEPTC